MPTPGSTVPTHMIHTYLFSSETRGARIGWENKGNSCPILTQNRRFKAKWIWRREGSEMEGGIALSPKTPACYTNHPRCELSWPGPSAATVIAEQACIGHNSPWLY